MTCRDARELLDSFIAQELLVETNHDLLRHLEGCDECRAELDVRTRLRSKLKDAFNRSVELQPRPELATHMAARLRTPHASRQAVSRPWRWMAAAAALVLATATGAYLVRERIPALARAAAGDHQNCAVKFALAEKPIPLADAAVRFDPAYAQLQTIPPDAVATARGMLRIADRHSCVFDGRRFGHVVYRLDDHLVSVLMTADDTRRADADRALSSMGRLDGFAVAQTQTSSHAVYVVSDLDDATFGVVAQALVEPLTQLAGSHPTLFMDPAAAHVEAIVRQVVSTLGSPDFAMRPLPRVE